MERTDIYNKLKEILVKIKPSADLTAIGDDTQLVRDLGLDSLTILLMALAVEKDFGIRFEGNPQFVTVGQVVDYVEKAL
ncbi:MAG: acyl carrier protein [Bacteroidales bacterium]|nr:acyl carrier protein [Bacteroidales bacterium]